MVVFADGISVDHAFIAVSVHQVDTRQIDVARKLEVGEFVVVPHMDGGNIEVSGFVIIDVVTVAWSLLETIRYQLLALFFHRLLVSRVRVSKRQAVERFRLAGRPEDQAEIVGATVSDNNQVRVGLFSDRLDEHVIKGLGEGVRRRIPESVRDIVFAGLKLNVGCDANNGINLYHVVFVERGAANPMVVRRCCRVVQGKHWKGAGCRQGEGQKTRFNHHGGLSS